MERGRELGGRCSLVVFKDVSCECRVLQRMVGLRKSPCVMLRSLSHESLSWGHKVDSGIAPV